jgi:hypothetical protein
MVLRNGFTVTGESACASPENFDPEIGRKIARENAVNKIWMLEGYLLKQRLAKNNTVTCHNSPPMRGLFYAHGSYSLITLGCLPPAAGKSERFVTG